MFSILALNAFHFKRGFQCHLKSLEQDSPSRITKLLIVFLFSLPGHSQSAIKLDLSVTIEYFWFCQMNRQTDQLSRSYLEVQIPPSRQAKRDKQNCSADLLAKCVGLFGECSRGGDSVPHVANKVGFCTGSLELKHCLAALLRGRFCGQANVG